MFCAFALELSISNIKSRFKRILLNIALMTVATTGLMAIAGFGLFTYKSLEERSARQTGHLVLTTPTYFDTTEDRVMQKGLDDFPNIRRKIMTNEGVDNALPLINFQGLIATDKKSLAFIGRGIDAKEIAIQGPFMNLLDGESIHYKFNANTIPQIMIGKGLADNLSVKVGDEITLLSNTTEDTLNGFDALIVGLFETGIAELDVRTVMTHYQTAQELLSTQRVHQIGIYLKDFSYTAKIKTILEQNFPHLKLTPWEDLALFYQGVKNLYNNIFLFIGSITFMIVFFAMYNLISQSIWERTREMGVLSAIGTPTKTIMASLLVESVMISAIALIFATLMYGLLTIGLTFADIHMSPPPGQTTGYPLQILFSTKAILLISIVTIFIAILSTYMASRKINQLAIIQALTHL